MPLLDIERNLEKTLVVVEYWDRDIIIKTTPGVFTSEETIIAYGIQPQMSAPGTSTQEISTPIIVKVRRENSDLPIHVKFVLFRGSVAEITVSCFELKSFHIL